MDSEGLHHFLIGYPSKHQLVNGEEFIHSIHGISLGAGDPNYGTFIMRPINPSSNTNEIVIKIWFPSKLPTKTYSFFDSKNELFKQRFKSTNELVQENSIRMPENSDPQTKTQLNLSKFDLYWSNQNRQTVMKLQTCTFDNTHGENVCKKSNPFRLAGMPDIEILNSKKIVVKDIPWSEAGLELSTTKTDGHYT